MLFNFVPPCKNSKKYEDFEKETARGTQAFRETFTSVKEKLEETIEDVQKSDYVKKAGESFVALYSLLDNSYDKKTKVHFPN